MKYKDAIAFYVARRNNSVNNKFPNCPTLFIADEEYAVTLGQWLGEFTNYKSLKNEMNYKYIDANYLIRKKMITNSDLEIVTKRFANLLKIIGISEDNICFFDNFKREKKEEVTFDCYLYNTGEVINMKVTFATINNCPELIVERNGVTTEYEHWYCKHDEPDRLGVQARYRYYNDTGSRRSFFYTIKYKYHGEIIDKVNKFEIDINYPDKYISTDIDNPYVDYDKLENLLSKIQFPVNFEEIKEQLLECLKLDISKYDITFKSLYNGKVLTYNFPEYIKINESHKELALCIGDWMEAYSPIMRELIPSNNTRKNILTSNGIKEISKRFTEILKIAGLNVNNCCELLNFNKENLSFECVFEDESIAIVQLIMGTEDDPSYKISIHYNNVTQVFNYYKGYEDEEDVTTKKLYLNSIVKKTDWGATFKRDIDSYCYKGELVDGDNKIEVEIGYPDCLTDTEDNNPFVDEDNLEKSICYADLPIEIIEFYQSIKRCFKLESTKYNIKIKGIKRTDDKDVVLGALSSSGAFVYDFTINRNGKIITVKPNGVWSYDSMDWQISQNCFQEISYTLKDTKVKEDKLDECPTPKQVFVEAKEEADIVRKLVKSLIRYK